MPAPESGPEWVLSSVAGKRRSDTAIDSKLAAAASTAWPKALAYARKESGRHGTEAEEVALATDVWEGVLRSVSKTLEGMDGGQSGITDLEAYLLGTFYHRFRRAVRKEQRREETIHLVSSIEELEALGTSSSNAPDHDLEASVEAKEILQRMDSWTRDIWIKREYGYSWNEIGKNLGVPGYRVMLRFRRRMGILRARLSRRR